MNRKYQSYVFDLTHPCVPSGGGVGAVEFDRLLRPHGLRLAWQVRRQAFVVYRPGNDAPITYMDLMKDVHLPLSPTLVNMVVAEVAKGNIQRSIRSSRVVRDYWEKQDYEKAAAKASHRDDIKPEARDRVDYLLNKQLHGKRSSRFFTFT